MTDINLIGECAKVAIDQLEQVKADLQKAVITELSSRQPGVVTVALKLGFNQSIERIQIQIDALKEVLEAKKL